MEHGEEEIFPDPVSDMMAESWRTGAAKALERQNAARSFSHSPSRLSKKERAACNVARSQPRRTAGLVGGWAHRDDLRAITS
jgi:hypothetical protein